MDVLTKNQVKKTLDWSRDASPQKNQPYSVGYNPLNTYIAYQYDRLRALGYGYNSVAYPLMRLVSPASRLYQHHHLLAKQPKLPPKALLRSVNLAP